MKVDPSLASSDIAIERGPRYPKMPAQELKGSCIGELVRCHADVIKLLAHREGHPVAVEQSPAPGGKNGAFSSLPLGLF
jgi:hypothetical protein